MGALRWTRRDSFGVAVVEVGKVERGVLGPDFHRFEGVAEIGSTQFIESHGFGIAPADGDQSVALTLVVHQKLLETLLIVLSGRAMIAGEDHD